MFVLKKIVFIIVLIFFLFPFVVISQTTVDDESLEIIRGMRVLKITCRWESSGAWVNYTTQKKIKGIILGAWTTPGTTPPSSYRCNILTQGATANDIFGGGLDSRSTTLAEYAKPLLDSSPISVEYNDKVTINMVGNTNNNSPTVFLQIWFIGEYTD